MAEDDKRSRTGKRGSQKPMRSRGFKDRPGGPPRGAAPDKKRAGPPPGGSRGYKQAPKSTVRPKIEKAVTGGDEVADDGGSNRPEERIAKRLARAGIASRRQAEALIVDGRVSVNGCVIATPAINVTADDTITVDGKPIPQAERTRLWLYHKPAGLVTSNRDPEGRPTVFERLPAELPRVVSVGRLDINTEGLLLLTNDGGLARILELPQTGWLRRYRVRAHGRITQKRLDDLRQGIAVDGVFYGAIEATLEREQGANVWIEIGLREGKNREVKNVLGALGLEVNRLIRISYGPFQLGSLDEGAVLEVRGRTLRDQLGARLIAESGADFDAPVLKSFPNTPVKAGDDRPPMGVNKKGDWVSGTRSAPKADKTGPKGHASDKRADRRERDRSRWSTKPQAAEAEEERKPRHRGNRSSNVWMAPGARPDGDGKRTPAGKPRGKPSGPRGSRKPDRS